MMLKHWGLLGVNVIVWECPVMLATRLGPRGLVFVKVAIFGQSRGYWTTLAGPVCLLRVMEGVLVNFQHMGMCFGEGRTGTCLSLMVTWQLSATHPDDV